MSARRISKSLAGAVQMQLLPAPANLAESRKLLALLKTFGPVSMYKVFRSSFIHLTYTRMQKFGSSLSDFSPKAQAIFTHPPDAAAFLAATPLTTPDGTRITAEKTKWDHEYYLQTVQARMEGTGTEELEREMATGMVKRWRTRKTEKYTGGFNGFGVGKPKPPQLPQSPQSSQSPQ